jgi:hypothetical protein
MPAEESAEGRESSIEARESSVEARWWKPLIAPSALLVAVFALQLVAHFSPQLTEHYYSRTLYPRVARLLGGVGSLTGFSLAEVLLVLLLALAAAGFAWLVRRLFLRRQAARELLLRALAGLLWTTGVGTLVFLLVFGLNYQRQPLADNLSLEQRDPEAREIETISRAVIAGINDNYAESRVDSAGERGSQLPLDRARLYEIIEAAYDAEPLLREVGAGGVARPKPVYFSGVMSRFGISGIYSPFTGEPNYNDAQVDCDLPFTIAHEVAHARGFARESEANFVAFLVCIRSSHPYVRYSGYLNALRVLGVLYRVSPQAYREIRATLGAGPLADLKARAAFWARYEGRLSNFSSQLNNAYLKVNGVRSGVRNYNESVWLVIGYYLKQARTPAPPVEP